HLTPFVWRGSYPWSRGGSRVIDVQVPFFVTPALKRSLLGRDLSRLSRAASVCSSGDFSRPRRNRSRSRGGGPGHLCSGRRTGKRRVFRAVSSRFFFSVGLSDKLVGTQRDKLVDIRTRQACRYSKRRACRVPTRLGLVLDRPWSLFWGLF